MTVSGMGRRYLTHADLCLMAAKWIKKPLSARGHGCQIAFTETRTSFLPGESPDAIGFRVSSRNYGGGSTVVECKVSRGDFRKDSGKPHRSAGEGMGRFRYYLCPEGLIDLSEVPEGWGLLYVNAKNTISVISGAALSIRTPGIYDRPYDAFAETMLLANLLHRIGNAEKLNSRLREADRINRQLQRRIEKTDEAFNRLQSEHWRHIAERLGSEKQNKAEHQVV